MCTTSVCIVSLFGHTARQPFDTPLGLCDHPYRQVWELLLELSHLSAGGEGAAVTGLAMVTSVGKAATCACHCDLYSFIVGPLLYRHRATHGCQPCCLCIIFVRRDTTTVVT